MRFHCWQAMLVQYNKNKSVSTLALGVNGSSCGSHRFGRAFLYPSEILDQK